jgi:hypothetical protein
MTKRVTQVIGITLFFPGHPQFPAYPLPVQTILDQIVGQDGSPMGQPVQHMGHTSAADFDEALVAQMNAIFAHVGLKLVREG